MLSTMQMESYALQCANTCVTYALTAQLVMFQEFDVKHEMLDIQVVDLILLAPTYTPCRCKPMLDTVHIHV